MDVGQASYAAYVDLESDVTSQLTLGVAGRYENASCLDVDNERVYVSAPEGLYALSPGTGKTLWHSPEKISRLLARDGRLYAHDGNTLFCLSAMSGKPLWSQPLSDSLVAEVSPPIFLEGRLLLTVNGTLLAFSPEGKKIGEWRSLQAMKH